jgi:hypothetical protein
MSMNQVSLGMAWCAYGWHQLGTNAMGDVSVMTKTILFVKQISTPTHRPEWKIGPLIRYQPQRYNHMNLVTN